MIERNPLTLIDNLTYDVGFKVGEKCRWAVGVYSSKNHSFVIDGQEVFIDPKNMVWVAQEISVPPKSNVKNK